MDSLDNYNFDKQHSKDKLHAIERIGLLLDKDSFLEVGSKVQHNCNNFGMDEKKLPYDGVITGFGTIAKKPVAIYSQDFTIMGGTLGEMHGKKISNIIRMAIKTKCPLIGINDSGGARIQEGVKALGGYGDIFYLNTLASGYIPQISIIVGPCAGGAVYSPGITDFVFVVDKISHMFVTGPKVIKKVLFESVDNESLGGAKLHTQESGVAHFFSENEKDCYCKVKQLLTYLPQYWDENLNEIDACIKDSIDKQRTFNLPDSSKKTYDSRFLLKAVLDRGSFFEVEERFAKNIIIGFAKICGISIGVVANQPCHLAGVIDCDASDKASRFIRFCDSFNIPIITFVDVPGYMPGQNQEKKGIIRHGSKLLYAYSEATVPKITIITRKAYGGAYISMCSKHLGADFVFAWENAEIAVMGSEGAVEVLFKKEIDKLDDDRKSAYFTEKVKEYEAEFINPQLAVENGYVDEIISKDSTRKMIIQSLNILKNKNSELLINKKHGNIPL